MITNKAAAACLGAIALSGCSLWHPMEPPIANALGRQIESGGMGRGYVLGGPLLDVSPSMIRIDDSKDTFSQSEYSSFGAMLNASLNGIIGSAGGKYEGSSLEISKGWKIIQISNLASVAPINKEFVYKCLTNDEYSFEAEGLTTANASTETSSIAKAFGTSVEVNIESVPSKPSLKKVTIKNPNVCMSFVSARLSLTDTNQIPIQTNFTQTIDGTKNSRFKLNSNNYSDEVTPDLGKEAKDGAPIYRLILSNSSENAPSLMVQIKNLDGPGSARSVVLKETSQNVWNETFGVENFQYEDMKYMLVRVKVDAIRLSDNTVEIISAKIYAPTYKLTLK